MKNYLKILSLLMVLVLALSVFTACEINIPTLDNTTTTAPDDTKDPLDDSKVKIYWCQGQKVLKEEAVEIGSLAKDWTPSVAGKEFLGWYSNPGCTTPFDFTQPITKEIEIYASFKTVSGGGVTDDPVMADYYLMGQGVGSLKYASWNNHNLSATKLGMSEVSGGKYTITIDFYAGDAFQICTNGSWDGQMGLGCILGATTLDGDETKGEVRDSNGVVVFTGVQEFGYPIDKWNITCAEGQDGQYIFTVDPSAREITWQLVKKLDPDSWTPVEKTYTLAGDEAFCGAFWDCAATANDLKLDEKTGLWTITFTNVLAGDYGFKICENYAWDVAYGDTNNPTDNNFAIKVVNHASTVIITFNAITKEITANDADGNDLHVKFEAPASSGIVVVGTVNDWKAENATGQYILTLGEDGKTWTGKITVETNVEIKLYDTSGIYGHDGGWIDPPAGTGENGNLQLSAGTYNLMYVAGDINFTFWADGEDAPSTPDTPVVPNPDVPTEGTVVYFQPTTGAEGCWDAYCEGYAVYCWNDAGNIWVMMEEIDAELSLYSATIPAGYSNVIFVSLKSLAAGGNWGNKDSQTVDLVLPTDGSNLFTLVNSWDEAVEWKGTGTWSVKE